MTTITCFNVTCNEIDKMGIVHHSNYVKWFERGRTDYLKKADIYNSQIIDQKFFLPLTDMECKFRSPAKYGDDIMIITSIIFMSCVKLKFDYKVLNNVTRKLIAAGKTVHVWTNKKIEPINMEKAAPEIYWRLKQFSGSLDAK